MLDLYERRFEGRRLHPGDYVVSAAGYEPVEQRIAVAAGRTTSSDVVLGGPGGTNDSVYPEERPGSVYPGEKNGARGHSG